jgi:hypothetical protein
MIKLAEPSFGLALSAATQAVFSIICPANWVLVTTSTVKGSGYDVPAARSSGDHVTVIVGRLVVPGRGKIAAPSQAKVAYRP